ncbi:UDP-glycosyltransferase 71K2 [Camellia lanceoleosa]|uniref:UDP-glycosyltransferase 71K2 n=1 Tax=Camellia lanceoleosa TaxID=1840588 RepID=A0ACC0J271_9ERIC|nr:UDP-glycosyltransferase 71K2 [Camellia lanceoleosa]
MIDVGNELALPSYLFLTFGAAFFGLMLYIPTRDHWVSTKFSESDPEFLISGFINPIPPLVFPAVFSKDDGYTAYLKLAKRFKDTKGIIVHTLLELESHAISSFCDDQAPSIYTVGSVIDAKGEAQNKLGSPGSHSKNNNIMKWLDDHGVPVL